MQILKKRELMQEHFYKKNNLNFNDKGQLQDHGFLNTFKNL